MRKLFRYGLLVSLVFLACTKTDVNNNQIASVQNDFSFGHFMMKQIENVKGFFENQIKTSLSQKFKKTPNWERALYAKMITGAEHFHVPLKYEKEYTFKTNFSGDKKFTLGEQSFLSIYKDALGKYQAEVVTIYPSETYLNNPNQPFQGLLTIDDCNENRIRTNLYKDGKLYKVENPSFYPADNSKPITGRTNEICMIVLHFWCEYGASNLSECTYTGYTAYENCADYQQLLPPGEGGEYVDAIAETKPWKWQVGANNTLWKVESWESVSGHKGVLKWCNGIFGPEGEFSEITHSNSYLSYGQDDYTWTQNGNTVSKSQCQVQSWIGGRLRLNSTGYSDSLQNTGTLSYQAWRNL
jgi:hypothetical protein